jgi:hypothetical protein
MCEAGEANGRKELAKEWSTFTEASKDGCIKRVGRHAPSYIELLVCLRSSTSSGGPLMPRWRVNFIGQYIGSVDAPDSETAISEAAKQFGITSAGRDRIVVKMIDSKPED